MYIDVLCIQNVYKCRDAKLIEETGTKARRFIVGALLQNIQRSAKRYGVWSIPGIPVTISRSNYYNRNVQDQLRPVFSI